MITDIIMGVLLSPVTYVLGIVSFLLYRRNHILGIVVATLSAVFMIGAFFVLVSVSQISCEWIDDNTTVCEEGGTTIVRHHEEP
jgi:hypothetical protein